ncbi:MAG: prepilin-type N-terminal cleavage/methylation domain-containing protein [Nitrosomonadales bacterium]|nr:prepilin-type N-terminal cleavage/methylation domain-containing protein [Nitrosomonadales bacterium]
MKQQSGFTLVELLIAVVIVSILGAVAIPAYTDYTKRGKISEATSNLASVRVAMEQYYQDNRSYLNGGACGATLPAAPTVQYFTFTCAATASTYTVTATGSGAMAGFAYTINEANTKASTVTGATGWSGNNACWVTKPGGAC